jgi:hypothetical protein
MRPGSVRSGQPYRMREFPESGRSRALGLSAGAAPAVLKCARRLDDTGWWPITGKSEASPRYNDAHRTGGNDDHRPTRSRGQR